MGTARAPAPTVTFVDAYCATYRDLFDDVRSFEHLSLLHVGLISDLPRKSLPAIGHRVGADPQALHHFIANADWSLDTLRQKRLELTRQALRGRPFVLIIDETGDLKQGKTTDYVARQYIGNIGALDRGVVSVSAYGVLDNVTFPLRFQIYKPEAGSSLTIPTALNQPSPSTSYASLSPRASSSSSSLPTRSMVRAAHSLPLPQYSTPPRGLAESQLCRTLRRTLVADLDRPRAHQGTRPMPDTASREPARRPDRL
jgi:DDE superfamily endonuclease